VSRTETSYIDVRNLTKRFGGHTVLDDISIGIARGQTLALLGPSGCGKTTMLRCIAGLESANAGSIDIAGQNVFDFNSGVDVPSESRQLGVVFQSYAVWPHMTVAGNIGFPLKVRGLSKAEIHRRTRDIVEVVGLGAWRDKPATQLSGGQQQRVAFARALVHEPAVVLFDEALSNLDTQLREQMRSELKVLQNRLGFTAIYVTHDQSEALALADRIVVLNRGKVEQAGAPREIFEAPATAFVAKFFGLNVLEGNVVQIERDNVAIAMSDGQLLRGRKGSACLEKGAPAVACIRKEHVLIGAGQPNDDGNRARAELLTTAYLGLVEEKVMRISGQEIRSLQPIAASKASGQVNLYISHDNCVILTC
jgi:iron(III) transport system ATP-binding protein